jgi:iron complex transport system substrate-binding protein
MAATAPAIFRVRLLGQQDGIVGISGYVVRPPQSRREKPRVSAFTSANIELKAIFPLGVCDYSRPGVGQQPRDGTWQMFPDQASRLQSRP